jgi:hypothetical protein
MSACSPPSATRPAWPPGRAALGSACVESAPPPSPPGRRAPCRSERHAPSPHPQLRPLCEPSGIFRLTGPSMPGISISAPSAACGKLIGITQCRSLPCAQKSRARGSTARYTNRPSDRPSGPRRPRPSSGCAFHPQRPGGTFTLSFTSLVTRVSPRQVWQGSPIHRSPSAAHAAGPRHGEEPLLVANLAPALALACKPMVRGPKRCRARGMSGKSPAGGSSPRSRCRKWRPQSRSPDRSADRRRAAGASRAAPCRPH